MTKRIAIGGFLHESHSFAPRPTTYADFVHPAGFPPLSEGVAMLDAVRGTSVPAAGALAIRVRAFCAVVFAGRAVRFALVVAITAIASR